MFSDVIGYGKGQWKARRERIREQRRAVVSHQSNPLAHFPSASLPPGTCSTMRCTGDGQGGVMIRGQASRQVTDCTRATPARWAHGMHQEVLALASTMVSADALGAFTSTLATTMVSAYALGAFTSTGPTLRNGGRPA